MYRVNKTSPWGREGNVVPIEDSPTVRYHVEQGTLSPLAEMKKDELPPVTVFDPADSSAEEVNAYLDSVDPEGEEYQRVLSAEVEGKNRKTVVGERVGK
jgi:hypothetical protein